MRLHSSPPSPFGRKIKIAAALLGLSDRFEIVITNTVDPADPVRQRNPLGKIPVLIPDGGEPLYDSRVILEYLDHLAGGGRIIPAEPTARFAALTLQALCDGIMDASILLMYEKRFRAPDRQDATWLDHQAGKVTRGLAVLEAAPPPLTATPDIGQIALACALGYRDLRFEGSWRKDHPKLVAWLDTFASRVPSFEATKVKP